MDLARPRETLLARLHRRAARLLRTVRPRFDFIAADVTARCNLRCPFCGTDFSTAGPVASMRPETFRKLTRLLGLVADGEGLLSCRFEPLLHPGFLELIESVQPALRRKLAFTTNLTLPVPPATFERLAASGLHHINVSVDSLRPGVFESLRRGGDFRQFAANFEALAMALRSRREKPALRCLTVVLRPNLEELPGLVERCARQYGATHHELRHLYAGSPVDADWRRANLPPTLAWTDLSKSFAAGPFQVSIDPPPYGYWPEDRADYSRLQGPSPSSSRAGVPLALLVGADGDARLLGRDDVRFRLDDLDDPDRFCRSRLASWLRGGT